MINNSAEGLLEVGTCVGAGAVGAGVSCISNGIIPFGKIRFSPSRVAYRETSCIFPCWSGIESVTSINCPLSTAVINSAFAPCASASSTTFCAIASVLIVGVAVFPIINTMIKITAKTTVEIVQ